jgi:hypothetical protein
MNTLSSVPICLSISAHELGLEGDGEKWQDRRFFFVFHHCLEKRGAMVKWRSTVRLHPCS